MEFDLTRILLTFALGAAAFLLARGLILAMLLEPRPPFIARQRFGTGLDRENSILQSATAIAVAAALGIGLENGAKRISWIAQSEMEPTKLSALVVFPLKRDMDLRRAVLLEHDPNAGNGAFRPTGLLNEVLSATPHQKQAEVSRSRLAALLHGQSVTWSPPASVAPATSTSGAPSLKYCYEDLYLTTDRTQDLSTPRSCVMHASQDALEELPRAVNDYFYSAKNEVFREDNYFEELKLIEDRETFARAFALLCLYGSYVAIGLSVAQGLLLWSYRGIVFQRRPEDPNADRRSAFRACASLFFALALLGGYWLAATAYAEEANEFYLRVFGYFVSLSQ